MIRDLLVYQDDGPASATALAYARALADAVDGRVRALMLSSVGIYPTGFYGDATAEVWLAAQEQAEKEAEALEQKLRQRIQRIAPQTELRTSKVVGGDASDRLAEFARYADATVLGISGGGVSDAQRRLFNAALFYSGRPLIVVPDKFEAAGAPERIVVAWSPTREAARALHDALPLLQRASGVRVVVVDDGARVESDSPGVDIAEHLAYQGVAADVKFVPRKAAGVTGTLLDEARYFDASMIVLGGYGHSRLSQWLLGGVSRNMLSASGMPLFFSH